MKTKTYSYTRFSSGIQSKGRSKARQQDSPEVLRFINEHNLEIVEKMLDSGVSGFSGKNFSETTALGKFIELVKAGQIEKGSVLLVENLDRFSRSEITDCMEKFVQIINNGVSIAVVQMNIIIDKAQANNQMVWQYVNNEFFRARRESERKAGFAMDNLRAKVARAKAGELVYFGAQTPLWIKGVENGKWILDEVKINTFKRAFKLYLEGHSCHYIAKVFNTENVPVMRGRNVCKWAQSTIKFLLQSKNVIGYCKMMDFENDSYYPTIIKPMDWQAVQTKLVSGSHNRGNSPDGNIPNLFKGVLHCTCGSNLIVNKNSHTNKNGDRNAFAYCRCKYVGACPTSFGFKMKFLEVAILSFLPQYAGLFKKSIVVPEVDALNDKLAKVDATINRITDTLSDPELANLTALKAKLKEQAAIKETLTKELQALQLQHNQSKQVPAASSAMFKLLGQSADREAIDKATSDLNATLKDTDKRFKVRNLVSEIFRSITLSYETGEQKALNIACELMTGFSFKIKLIITSPSTFTVEA